MEIRPDTVPQGWSSVKLGDILPAEAFPALEKLASVVAPVAAWKALCRKHREHLLGHGVEPDYLGWVLYTQFSLGVKL